MGILQRASDILRANLNDLLDHAEDPEKMLNQILLDMEDAIQQSEAQVAEQLAQEKLIQSDLDTATANAAQWGKKAELAVSKGVDDLAKEALHRQNDYSAQVEIYKKQLAAQHQADEKLKADLDALKSKYDDAVRNKQLLITRAKRAQAQLGMQKAEKQLSDSNIDYSGQFAHMTRRIEEQEARVAANEDVKTATVEDRFAKLSDQDQVDGQLAALKAKMGK